MTSSYPRQTSGISLRQTSPPPHTHHVRTNPSARPRSCQSRLCPICTHLHLARCRDAYPNRTHPHTVAHLNPPRIYHCRTARLTLPHISNPHADTIAVALTLALPGTALRNPQPHHPCAKPMDTLLFPDFAIQRPHIHFYTQDLLAGRALSRSLT
jgi:hypothetical protein